MKDSLANGGMPPRRIMALWFPRLASERILRGRLGRSWRAAARREEVGGPPLVLACRDGNARRIAALDERASALGLRRGMGVADARAMHPGIEIVEADAAADRRLLESLADWCDRYTPLVALAGPDGLFLDITGCAHLFGGEQGMLDDALGRLLDQGFRARAGLASTPGMAWAAARFLEPSPVAAGAEAAALSPLPLAALRLEPALRADLASVGLHTVGTVMAAPRAPLARRFGRALLMRLDQALGRLDEAVSPRLPAPPLSAERHLVEPVVAVEDVERLVLMLSQALKADLERRDEGARVLQLALFRVDGAVRRLTVGASRPLREPELVHRLFREKLAAVGEALDAECGFELVRLSALAVARFEARQGDLVADPAAGSRGDDAGLALFADRVRARLGQAALAMPRPVESHVPERAVALVPFAALSSAGLPSAALPSAALHSAGLALRPSARAAPTLVFDAPVLDAPVLDAQACAPVERPIRLFSLPEPVEVMGVEVPEGPPLRFRWRRALHRVVRAEGPERIAPEWWREGREETPTRDYFRVEDEEGRRYWLFRQGLYGATPEMPRWFLHGIFA